MASSRLYKDAHVSFVEGCKARYRDKKDREILQDFLQQHGSPEEAQAAAQNLKSDANQKWGGQKMGDVEIPQAWIDKVMANIQNFIAVGNFAMQGAPESIGLAWFGFKLTLSAIQSNYALYNLFGSGLTDISEIMIITLHYDSLYDERSKTKAKAEWKNNPVVDKLFTDIISMYIAVLDFSLSVRRHLSAGTLAKVRHGFKDFFGASEAKFRGKLDDIASVKRKILDDSQAIFQDKSLQQLGTVRDIVSNIESTVNQIKDFQGTLQKMREEQAAQLTLLLKKMEDITAIVKHPTPWDLAIKEFDKNKDVLKPQDETIDALGEAIDRRFPDTCLWIFDQDQYKEWRSSNTSSLLCLTGRQGEHYRYTVCGIRLTRCRLWEIDGVGDGCPTYRPRHRRHRWTHISLVWFYR